MVPGQNLTIMAIRIAELTFGNSLLNIAKTSPSHPKYLMKTTIPKVMYKINLFLIEMLNPLSGSEPDRGTMQRVEELTLP